MQKEDERKGKGKKNRIESPATESKELNGNIEIIDAKKTGQKDMSREGMTGNKEAATEIGADQEKDGKDDLKEQKEAVHLLENRDLRQ